jgi:transcriptional regulator with XRE-family HTH domain
MLRIKELCKEKGISLDVLATKRLGITNQALYASINGNPTLERLKQIADALDVPITELFEAPPHNSTLTCPNCGAKLGIEIKITS